MTIPEYFGSMVFDDRVMKARLSADVYHSLRQTIDQGTKLDLSVANAVAAAMKDWAVEKGATHFTHWFQPMTGITAEKHDSFISPAPDGRVILEFSGKELIKGEPDASSFPSGGLRATFEARGYTAWDPTSYAFVKGKVLYIPTAFCSYGGEALDKKTPLLRSMDALNRQAMRILRLFGNEGVNLLSPGETPHENAQFLLFLCAVIQAVDDYQDLLRTSVATAGNDHRLGANEAPPAVVSIFLGDELTAVLQSIEADTPYHGTERTRMKLGVPSLPRFLRDTTDRNRTSPFAFTGNKFEFRMLGSSNSIACANIMLNSAVADTLRKFADRLEGAEDFDSAIHALIRDTIIAHKRILFNGNGYDDAWLEEAARRGLSNLRTTPDCVPCLLEKKNMDMLTGLGVYTPAELESRYEITLENYCKTVSIEALTMVDMARRDILPAVERCAAQVASAAAAKKAVDCQLPCAYETGLVRRLSGLTDRIADETAALEQLMVQLHSAGDGAETASRIRDEVLPAMAALRATVDEAETQTAGRCWPYPTYGELLFSVR